MADTEQLQPKGDKLKKTLSWVAEMHQIHPEMNRQEIIEKAQIRFNLTPKECEFLNSNFLG